MGRKNSTPDRVIGSDNLVVTFTDTKIKDVFRSLNFYNIPLEEDDVDFGGLAHEGETLGEFMQSVSINSDDSFILLQKSLKENGIKPINVLEMLR